MFSAPNLTYVQRTKEIQDIKKSFIDIFTIDLDYLKVVRYSLIQKKSFASRLGILFGGGQH
jgi:hypothetical protein